MKITFVGLTTEYIKKPGNKMGFTKAVIDYTFNGEPRKQNMVSFANPAVFKQVQELTPGQEIDVELTKNGEGFSEWKSINVGIVGSPSVTGVVSTSNATRVTGSNYETRDERAARQVLIVKQSSLSAAVATLTPGAKAPLDQQDVLALAQTYVDWVFDNGESE